MTLVLVVLIIADAVKFIADKIYQYNKLVIAENKYQEWLKDE